MNRRRKVLLSIPYTSSYYPGISRAFGYLGYEVRNFDYRKFTFKEKVTVVTLGRKPAHQSLDHRLLGVVKEYQPDLLLTIKGETISESTMEAISRSGVVTVNWFVDYGASALELSYTLSGFWNLFLHFDPYTISVLRKRGRKNVYYLPFAADILPSDLELNEKLPRKYDISVAGNYYPEREEALRSLQGLGLHIWGGSRWATTSVKNYYGGTLPFPKLREVLEESKISVNVQSNYPCFGAVLRVFEVLSSGSFLLSEDIKDLRRLFAVGQDLVVFKDSADLRSKAIFYLGHQREREKIARRGHQTVRSHHTYVHRFRKLFQDLGLG